MTDLREDGANTGRILTNLLLVTLVLSLFLNVYMIFRPPPQLKISSPKEDERQPKIEVQAGQMKVYTPAEGDCAAKLKRCRQAEITEIVKVIQAGASAGSGARKGLRAEASVGAELQQSVLCDITRRKQHRRWFDKRNKIAESLVPNLLDHDKQQRDLEKDVKEFSRVLGWSEAQGARFQRRYEQARRKRLASIVKALQREPRAFDAVLSQVKGLYGDEDRLVRELFGDKARQQLRAARLENRTVIMAIAAAMAKVPWDHSISW